MCDMSAAAIWWIASLSTAAGILLGASVAIDSLPYEGLPRTAMDHVRACVGGFAGFCLGALVVGVILLLGHSVWNLIF